MYKFAQCNQKLIPNYTNLLRTIFKKKFKHEYIKWLYFENPTGSVLGYDAFDNNKLVAHYACIPINICYLGKSIKSLLSLNTATLPEYSGQGLFTSLATKTYILAKKQSFSLIIGVANANSTYGFTNKLDFELITPLNVKLYYQHPQKKIDFKSHFYRIWNQQEIKWRIANPHYKYYQSQHNLYSQINNLGLKVWINTNKLIINENDLLSIQNPFSILPKLWIGLDNSLIWNKKYSINLPKFIRSSPLNLIIKHLNGKRINLDINTIKFYSADFDVY